MTGQVRFEVWGTTAHLLVSDAAALPAAEHELRALLARIDRACSRFRADSALSRLNAAAGTAGNAATAGAAGNAATAGAAGNAATAGAAGNAATAGAAAKAGTAAVAGAPGRTTVVDPVLLAAVGVALRAAEASGGLVDPTVGRALAAIGYDRDLAAIPADSPEPVRPVPAAGWRAVAVDDALGAIRLPAGVALDLGATAKAWAADLAAAGLADRFGCAVLVNLGGDLAVGGTAQEGWRVRVAEHHTAGREAPGQVVTVRSGGLATSSRTVRTWRRAGRPVHHLIDPRTGLPAAATWRCVSVAAADCVGANTAATAAMILGPAAPAWLAARDLPARLVAADGAVRTVAGWPAEHVGVAACGDSA
jgi:thiamine biosynthesis lipoprotein